MGSVCGRSGHVLGVEMHTAVCFLGKGGAGTRKPRESREKRGRAGMVGFGFGFGLDT